MFWKILYTRGAWKAKYLRNEGFELMAKGRYKLTHLLWRKMKLPYKFRCKIGSNVFGPIEFWKIKGSREYFKMLGLSDIFPEKSFIDHLPIKYNREYGNGRPFYNIVIGALNVFYEFEEFGQLPARRFSSFWGRMRRGGAVIIESGFFPFWISLEYWLH